MPEQTTPPKVLHLQASGKTFHNAWVGQHVQLPDNLNVGSQDIVVLGEWLPDTKKLSGRSVQGRYTHANAQGGSRVGVFSPSVCWDLRHWQSDPFGNLEEVLRRKANP